MERLAELGADEELARIARSGGDDFSYKAKCEARSLIKDDDRYRKQGSIPAGDFFYLTSAGKNMLSDNGLSLAKTDSFDPSDLMLITDWALEESLKSAPDDSTEVAGIRSALAECRRLESEDKLPEPPKIRKAFYEPIPAFFLILLTAAVSVLVFYEGFDARDSYFFIVGGIMAVLGLGGAIMLVLRKKAIWYLPLIAMIALFWVADAHIWGEDLQYHLEEPVIISAVILIVALCWLPYVRKKQNEKKRDREGETKHEKSDSNATVCRHADCNDGRRSLCRK